MNKKASQPRAIYYVVALQIWEYFSFYGMRALLILYLPDWQHILSEMTSLYQRQLVCWDIHIQVALLTVWARLIENEFYESISKVDNKNNIDTAKKTISWINEHYDREITLEDIANSVSLSKEHACRKFKQATGLTLFQYVNKIRVNRAHDLIKNSNKKISDIAFSCGFNNFSYFFRVFKTITGVLPRHIPRNNKIMAGQSTDLP